MPVCPINGCVSNSSNESISWHDFPTDEKKKNEWMLATRLKDTQKICSKHFKKKDFDMEQAQGVAAIPSRFPWMKEWLQTMVKKKEKEEESPISNFSPNTLKLAIALKNGHNVDFINKLLFKAKTSSEQKNESKKKEVKFTESCVQDHLLKLESATRSIENFLSSKSFLFTSTIESIKAQDNLNTYFKKPYILNQTFPMSKEVSVMEGLEILKEFQAKPKKNIPPPGELKRSPLVISSKVIVMKTTSLVGIWVKGSILFINDNGTGNQITYRVKCGGTIMPKSYTTKQMAYDKPPDVQIPVGTRIVAKYRPEDMSMIRQSLYAGIIAEPPKLINNFRYLVFFDDGYAQYIDHDDIHIVCSQSADVSEDIYPRMKEFIKTYLRQYPERPMVKLQQNQYIKTEWNGKWWKARVLDVDASMVKMCFEADERVEWIYRGSTRIGLLFEELAKAEDNRLSGKHRRHNIEQKKPHQPYVEYTRDSERPESDIEVLDIGDEGSPEVKKSMHAKRKTGGGQYIHKEKNTARKSTTQSKIISNELPYSDTPDRLSHQGYREMHLLTTFNRRTYYSHACSPLCRDAKAEKDLLNSKNRKERSPFVLPIFLGFERQYRQSTLLNSRPIIIYRAPCGRHLRSISEVNKYLSIVGSSIPIDFFTFHINVLIFRTFRPKVEYYKNEDITEGKENVPISVVNSLSNEPPPYVEYESERFPGKGVDLNLDEEFLCGCDCTDNCLNSERCQCIQLTHRTYSEDGAYPLIGYDHRRLKDTVVTGLYECNSRCKCGPQCMNRVVQNGIQVRLQMFKTQKKGWGIRCLDDVEPGMFICIYAGQLLTDQGADADGFQFGDEYLAELDHIEVCEKMKDGYEADVSIYDMDVEIETTNEKQADDEINIDDNEDEDDDNDNDDNEDNESSGSDINICVDSDSDFESAPPLRNTAMSNAAYITRSKGKNSNNFPVITETASSEILFNDSLNMGTPERENMETPETEKMEIPEAENMETSAAKMELPDIDPIFSPFKIQPINLNPLSEEEAAIIDNLKLGRKPKMSKTEENGSLKVTAKKSMSMKNSSSTSLSHPTVPPPKKIKYASIRTYFNEDSCYIMDAKSKGNIGRYLNHSCHPNVFVQNVFVDSHDLRFPSIAFFAINHIDAGTELTWDYNYEVGSVEDKVMYCYCESRKCRGRLL